jgi:hypothetical protein
MPVAVVEHEVGVAADGERLMFDECDLAAEIDVQSHVE